MENGQSQSNQRAVPVDERSSEAHGWRPVNQAATGPGGLLDRSQLWAYAHYVPRPRIARRVCCAHTSRGLRPIGRPVAGLPVVTLAPDELEAIRLADRELLYQEAAAERMGVSRQTYARILSRARQAVARSLIDGAVLLVAGSPATVGQAEPPPRCPVHGGPRRLGRGCRCHHSFGDQSS